METGREQTVKFFVAVNVCRDFADIMLRQLDKDIFNVLDIFEKQVKTLEQMLEFLGADAPEELRNGILWELDKLKRARKWAHRLDKGSFRDIFRDARKYIFQVTGGDATQYIKELTENKSLTDEAWEPNPEYPLDIKNCPLIKTINQGQYQCHSNYPTRDSEEHAVLNNIVNLLNKACGKNITPATWR
jgi:hypothetical protein